MQNGSDESTFLFTCLRLIPPTFRNFYMAVQHNYMVYAFAVLSVFSSLIQVSFSFASHNSYFKSLSLFLSFYSISSSAAPRWHHSVSEGIKPRMEDPFLPTDKCVSTLFSFLLLSVPGSYSLFQFSRGFVPCIIFSLQVSVFNLFVLLFPTAYKLVQNLPRNSILTVFPRLQT